MKNNKIVKNIVKYLPIYVVSLLFLFLHKYIMSLTGPFIGEVLGTLNNDSSILPKALHKFITNDSLESKITSLAIIYIVVSSIGVGIDFLTRALRVIHFQKLYVGLSKDFYSHVLDIPKSEYSNRSTGDIIQRNIEDCKRIPGIFRQSVYELFRIIFTT